MTLCWVFRHSLKVPKTFRECEAYNMSDCIFCKIVDGTAKAEVPATGVPSKVTEADLAANLDPKGKKK